jgi:type II secretory pathway pseudopilin PulG
MKKYRREKGITLVALVITIIILLILAGITIATLGGENGLFARAKQAKNNTIDAQDAENNAIKGYEAIIDEILGENQDNPEDSEIPEGLEIGSKVSYSPGGKYTEWTREYSGASKNYILASGSEYDSENSSLTDMTITEWRVFSIDTSTGKIQLVPANQGTNKVQLNGANGYNNGVKLLNDACNSLYGNGSTITARSINKEDYETILANYGFDCTSPRYGLYSYPLRYTIILFLLCKFE